MNANNESQNEARMKIGPIFFSFNEVLTRIVNEVRNSNRIQSLYKVLSQSVENQCFEEIEGALTGDKRPRICSASEAEWGLVYITDGPLKGRMAYYDDDDKKNAIVTLRDPTLSQDYRTVAQKLLVGLPNYQNDWSICMNGICSCVEPLAPPFDIDPSQFKISTEGAPLERVGILINAVEKSIANEIAKTGAKKKSKVLFSPAVRELIEDDVKRAIADLPRIRLPRKGEIAIVTTGKFVGTVGVVEPTSQETLDKVVICMKPRTKTKITVDQFDVKLFPMSRVDFDEMSSHLVI